MPELPEVERAAALVRTLALNKKIEKVLTSEDALIFSGISHQEFAKELVGRTIANVGRYGKVFYFELDGKGRMPVFHFGMTGTLQVKGEAPTYYKGGLRKVSTEWPPRFMKFILHISSPSSEVVTEIAYSDARRLGRIRLVTSPFNEPPISTMGFDPILSMPGIDGFKKVVIKRSCPIKSLLLNQSFSAGIGNWVADEVLYHSRVHPEQRCNTLSEDQLIALHHQIIEVCRIAVEANADDAKFPQDWLFKHRWSSGELATIKWITVGGRTSAYVAELQHLPNDLTPLPDSDADAVVQTTRRKRKESASKTLRGSKIRESKRVKTSRQ
ncbi:hypothetical protein HETIRDRAFT_154087 [Heterobasidion irregulare TC 32-1]|uniref:Formamidopyrimidine-DNA glycosylase catalytic domain-containing protein n=1 Tax=Heterobasidion irregulare (strain TC 32-1) TaxID=747525 RepID=W4KPH0_HETIT|nr:uncharacterized protein HETIRDRAFT_154087 [Heterobasidion irregulare TC 32-1]ETW87707.1 hypothetical protein HETIRDRAFT_154087 [Heterobasidion irregulare TC 32-1]